MISKKIEKGSPEFKLLTDWWSFHQKYYRAENDDDIDTLIFEAEEFFKKYKGTDLERLAKGLILAHQDDVGWRATNDFKEANMH